MSRLLIGLILLSGCVCPNIGGHKYTATVGISNKTLKNIGKHKPIQATVQLHETGELVEVTIHRDDKRGK